jgi:c-di-GMP-binding flagellar brake protein YcgR
MQYWNSIKAGDKIELIPFDQKEDGEQKVYLSKIQDLKTVGIMEILMPMEQGKRHFISNNTRHTIVIYTDSGMFQAECKVIDRYQAGAVFLLKIQLLKSLFKKQRREFFRLKCDRPVEYRIISKEEAHMREKLWHNDFENAQEKEDIINKLLDFAMTEDWEEGILLDLSGGGLRAKIPKIQEEEEKEKEPDSRLMFRLNLFIEGEVKPFEVEGTVLSSSDIVNDSAKKELRCRFLHISSHKQEILAKYIFDEQRIQRAGAKK